MTTQEDKLSRRREQFSIVGVLIVTAGTILAISTYWQNVRVEELTRVIEMAGGEVIAGPTPIEKFRRWWSGANGGIWTLGATLTLEDRCHLDSVWLYEQDFLADMPISILCCFDHSLVENRDIVGIINCHPLKIFAGVELQLADSIAEVLADKGELIEVEISECDLSDEGFRRLPLVQLKGLYVQYTAVTPSGLSELRRCRKLKYIAIDGEQLDSHVVATLYGLSDLEEVILCGPQVDDDSVRLIAALPKLRVLTLDGTAVTKSGIKELRQAMPAAKIQVE